MISSTLLSLMAAVAPSDAPPVALPQDAAAADDAAWTGSFNLGANFTSGNSETFAATAALDAERRGADDRWTLNAYWNFGEQDVVNDPATGIPGTHSEISQRDYGLSAKYDYFYSEKTYLYGIGSYAYDAIANLDSRITLGAGLGHQFREDDKIKFSAEAGLSYVTDDFIVNPVPPPTIEDSYVAVRAAYDYFHQLSDTSRFEQQGEILPSLSDTSDVTTKVTTRLSTDLTASMQSFIQHVWDWDNTPAGLGIDRSDHQVTVGVGWTF